jgi:uncharacterized protein YdhG (YjbR/CyaY superfamily)
METPKYKFTSVDEYISTFEPAVQAKLELLRQTIMQAAPNAQEVISYNMPAYKQNGVLVYFAAYKNHIGFYPTSSPMVVFKDVLTAYKTSKGAIQFPMDSPIPKNLVTDIVVYRIQDDLEKAARKKKK